MELCQMCCWSLGVGRLLCVDLESKSVFPLQQAAVLRPPGSSKASFHLNPGCGNHWKTHKYLLIYHNKMYTAKHKNMRFDLIVMNNDMLRPTKHKYICMYSTI